MTTTQPTTADMNRVIAEFTGKRVNRRDVDDYNDDWGYNLEFNPSSESKRVPPIWYNENYLQFHLSFNWLMPAWSKLYKLLWDLRNKGEKVYNNGRNFVDQFSIAINANDIASAHNILYNALLWYNTQCAPS